MSAVAVHWTKQLLFNPRYFWAVAAGIIVGDAVLTQLIIRYVSFTEIDWETYMYHIDLFTKGERNYALIVGPSGPLVYPAGHVWIHRFLSSITNSGLNLRLAQQIYGGLYLLSNVLTCAIYRRGGVPNYVLLTLPLSKRLHSIFVLRLFNDGWTLILSQMAILAYAYNLDDLGSILLSAALSVKMSVLLYVPGLLVILFKKHGLVGTLRHVATIITVQLAIASTFLQSYPKEYLANAFEFSRVFIYRWTVNWRFVSEETFLSHKWAYILLAGHLSTLCLFAWFKWCRSDGGTINVLFRGLQNPLSRPSSRAVSSDQIITVLFTSNLIGIIFARSLHYQFYSWYAQQLPFLLSRTKFPYALRLILLACIEYCWNVFPSTYLSSRLLLAANLGVLYGIWNGFPEGVDGSLGEKRETIKTD
ncbi:glycosyltransferase family 58 protein [Sphaerobolus stellatus SS14]|uniref:Dol-P-Man:Man(5)GlcNAc(2)-PP-Dol alpha-1,3-mannosyltransferase n=1 Tax=Sphaerobolus stellatus (strain SS14) TaxID=990650 RepID=A0A0C9TWA1_SPHS4|nr:glycosyltransferase family 58 protein [Sphaerobolus stellatus SS14]